MDKHGKKYQNLEQELTDVVAAMNFDSDDSFIGWDSDGEEKKYFKLIEFDSGDTHYLVYSEDNVNEDGCIPAHVATVTRIDGSEDEVLLEDVEDEWIIDQCMKILSTVQETFKDN